MRIVLDASAALELALRGNRAKQFGEVFTEASEILAPELFVPEVVNAVWKYYQFEHVDLTVCERAIERAFDLVDVFIAGRELYREAFLLARVIRRPAYDMFYLALARREDANLLTTDAALRKEAKRQGIKTL